MNITDISFRNPYIVVALCITVAVLGLASFFNTPVDLFPDTTPPQVLVITIEPAAAAKDISDKITEVMEKELNTISGIKRVRATSRDEVSSVLAEFYYSKDINEAVTDVTNALGRIKAELPQDILPSQIYKITDATKPTLTLGLSPKNDTKTLRDVRLLAENDIKDQLLRIPDVGDIDIFGGYLPEVKILVDRDTLKGYELSLIDVISAIRKRNVTIPGGYLYTRGKEYLIRTTAEFKDLNQIETVPIKKSKEGYILLKDVAEVRLGFQERRSLYHGNGHPAIAINILRPEKGHTLKTINSIKKYLPVLKVEYPDIRFEITDDQEPIIDINLKGMRSSLIQAIILTILIIFIFLADRRTAAIISVSIPMSFLFSLTVLSFSPYTLNMVTLSGLIIAVGMVVDASIVVLENIYRHFEQDKGLTPYTAAILGAKEIALANAAGTFTTIIVLIPVMFTGGYPQQVLRQLSIIIGSTIFASLISSLTIVPLIASRILKRNNKEKSFIEKKVNKFDGCVKAISGFYVSILKVALKNKGKTLLLVVFVFAVTMKVVVPLLVGELMPPMDTGIVKINLDIPSDFNVDTVEKILCSVEEFIMRTPGYLSLSSVVGSEPGEVSFGHGGATAQQAYLTVHLVTRDKRKKKIWQIEDEWRDKLRRIEGIRSFTVMEYGATPISTTKAPFDLILMGKNPDLLNVMADRVLANLKGVKGLVDIRRSWYMDKPEVEVVPDAVLCKYYGVNTEDVAHYIKFAAKGEFSSFMRLEDFLDIPIRVEYEEENLNSVPKIDSVYIPTKFGQVLLRSLVKTNDAYIQPFITREDIENTIDITGVNRVYTIVQAAGDAKKVLGKKQGVLPAGYSVRMSGTPADMADTKARLMKALSFGLILLYMLILPMYKSFSHPVVIMAAIPLAAIGAFWGLLVFNKPMCMPALMGMILLAGTIVNNAILLLDFIVSARKKGISRDEAIIQSVTIRTRPILMTASSTVIGLTPLVFEMAVGLERLSPLGIVAASGLILGTFLTMIVIPVIYALIDDLKNRLSFSNKAVSLLSVFLFLFLVLGSSANAEDKNQNGVKRFSLQETIDYSLKNSPDLKVAEAEVEKSLGNKLSTRSFLLPKINLNSSYTNYGNKHPIVPGIIGTEQRFDDNIITGTIEADWLLTDFGKSFYAFKSSKSSYLASLQSKERKQEFVIFTVGSIYFNIVSLEKLIEARRDNYKSIAELQRRIELFFKEGKVATIDLLQVKVRLSQIEDEIEQLKAQKTFLVALLAEEMGYTGDLEVDENLNIIKPPYLPSSSEAFKTAMDNREDLSENNLLSQASHFELISNRRSYFPDIRFFSGWGKFSGTSGESKFSGNKRWEDDYWVGMKISFPLFDSWYRKGKVLSSLGDYNKQEAETHKIVTTIYKDVKKAMADISSADKRVSLAKDSEKSAAETLRLEKLKYKEGKGIINDVLDADTALREADSLLYSAIADNNTAVFELKLAQGLLSENYLQLIPQAQAEEVSREGKGRE